MSDYTPTTEEIRDDYALLADASRPRHMQFDRWLAEVKAQAWEEGFNAKWYDYSENPEQGNPYRGREQVSEYTPTTEEVRMVFWSWMTMNHKARNIAPADHYAEFDRWLAEVKVKERERVIKLIEAQDKWNDHFWDNDPYTTACDCYGCEDVRTLIDLIRKENNDS